MKQSNAQEESAASIAGSCLLHPSPFVFFLYFLKVKTKLPSLSDLAAAAVGWWLFLIALQLTSCYHLSDPGHPAGTHKKSLMAKYIQMMPPPQKPSFETWKDAQCGVTAGDDEHVSSTTTTRAHDNINTKKMTVLVLLSDWISRAKKKSLGWQ